MWVHAAGQAPPCAPWGAAGVWHAGLRPSSAVGLSTPWTLADTLGLGSVSSKPRWRRGLCPLRWPQDYCGKDPLSPRGWS